MMHLTRCWCISGSPFAATNLTHPQVRLCAVGQNNIKTKTAHRASVCIWGLHAIPGARTRNDQTSSQLPSPFALIAQLDSNISRSGPYGTKQLGI